MQMFHVPAIVSELTVGVALRDRLQTAEALRLARVATAHQKTKPQANPTSPLVRAWLTLTKRSAMRARVLRCILPQVHLPHQLEGDGRRPTGS